MEKTKQDVWLVRDEHTDDEWDSMEIFLELFSRLGKFDVPGDRPREFSAEEVRGCVPRKKAKAAVEFCAVLPSDSILQKGKKWFNLANRHDVTDEFESRTGCDVGFRFKKKGEDSSRWMGIDPFADPGTKSENKKVKSKKGKGKKGKGKKEKGFSLNHLTGKPFTVERGESYVDEDKRYYAGLLHSKPLKDGKKDVKNLALPEARLAEIFGNDGYMSNFKTCKPSQMGKNELTSCFALVRDDQGGLDGEASRLVFVSNVELEGSKRIGNSQFWTCAVERLVEDPVWWQVMNACYVNGNKQYTKDSKLLEEHGDAMSRLFDSDRDGK